MAEKQQGYDYLSYRGKSLVRTANTLYYGDPAEAYIAMIQITETSKAGDKELPSLLAVQILSTNEELPILERIKKNTVRKNLFDAVNIASIWLERILVDENSLEGEE